MKVKFAQIFNRFFFITLIFVIGFFTGFVIACITVGSVKITVSRASFIEKVNSLICSNIGRSSSGTGKSKIF